MRKNKGRRVHPLLLLGVTKKFACRRVAAAGALWLCAAAGASFAQDSLTLTQRVVPARGEQATEIDIPRFGRYSVGVKSTQGVALQLVDHMSGPGAYVGGAGQEDGRIDAFFDQGKYKVLAHAAPDGSGDATFSVQAFAEQSRPVSMLVELRDEHATLADYQQRSYWLHIEQRRWVALEAAGRYLADLRLWQDGDWLVDVAPQCSAIEPRVGQPLQTCRLAAELNPGFYLLTAYGGPGAPWAEQSLEQPFHLRYGIPKLSEAGRQRFVASEFGTDRYLVPQAATYFRLELPTAETARLAVADFDSSHPFNEDGVAEEIGKKSSPPVAQLNRGRSSGDFHLVTITRAPGEAYVLQQFEQQTAYSFRSTGNFWLSTIHSGHAADSIDATALITRQHNGPMQFLDARTIAIDERNGWRRRFNLLETATLFIQVATAGEYRMAAQGDATARVRIEPFLAFRPPNYQTPASVALPHTWTLDPGYYVVTAEPEVKGIIDLQLGAKDQEIALNATPLLAAAGFGAMQLHADNNYTVFINSQPGVAAGVVLRSLPADLVTPLPIVQMPNEQIEIPVAVKARGVIKAIAEDGSANEIALVGGAWQKQLQVAPNTYRIAVRPPKNETQSYALTFTPDSLHAVPPVPSPAALAQRPHFPTLTADAPHFIDIERGGTATFNVQVAEPGLYRLESTGLLQTSGNVRTRTTTALVRDEAGGIGRNFLLQQYLRAGDYQLTVGAMNASRGRMGVQLARTALTDGGSLELGLANRALLPTGHALAYRFSIAHAGEHRLQVLGLGRNYNMRVEDEHGWPIASPNIAGDLTQHFNAGRYRVIVLPQATDVRVLTLLTPISPPLAFSGHGPHELPMATRVAHTWMEPDANAERAADVWRFSLAAAADVALDLGEGMQAELLRDDDSVKQADIGGGKIWRGALAKGAYRLNVVSARPNNRAPYHIKVSTEQLLVGHARAITAPATLSLAIGATGLVELASFGSDDVRARLFDSEQRLLASNDDRPTDWNFHIAQRLAPGVYRLQIDAVGRDSAQTTVSVAMPAERVHPALSLPAQVTVADTATHIYPLTFARDANVLVVNARADTTVGIAIESAPNDTGGKTGGDTWRVVATRAGRVARIEVPIGARAQRLRVWSVDGRPAAIQVDLQAAAIKSVSESQWAKGVRPTMIAGGGIVAVDVKTPGVFRLANPGAGVRVASADDAALTEVKGDIVQIDGARVWLTVDDDAAQSSRAQRVYLSDELNALPLAAAKPVRIDLAPGNDAVLVWAESRHGQPGVRIDDIAATDVAAASAMLGVQGQTTIAVARTPQRPVVTVWNADDETRPLEATVHYARFATAPTRTLTWGISTGALAAQAQIFNLPLGAKRMRLALPVRTAAVFSRGARTLSTHWSGEAGAVETISTDADQLWLLPASNADALYSIEAMPSTGHADVRPGGLLRHASADAGTLRVAVTAAAQPTQLHVLGAHAVTFIGDDGRIERADKINVRVSGALSIEHGPQTVVVWMEQAVGTADAAPSSTVRPPATVQPPATVALTGAQLDLAIQANAAALVSVETDVPVIVRGRDNAGAEWVQMYAQAARFSLYAPSASARVNLFPLTGDTLSGHARVTVAPIKAIGEGVASETLVLPGAAQAFRFNVERASAIGIGVKASTDIVSATLLSGDGQRKLGEGVVQMPELTPGAYILLVRTPADAAPVRVQPIVLGLNPQGTGPSADLIRRYVEAGANDGPIAIPDIAPEVAPSETPPAVTNPEPAETESSAEPPQEIESE